ncbi:MAG: STAS-like domain-containing protein [Actinomycetota bacterium]
MTTELAKGESIPWLIRELLDGREHISSGDVAEAAGVTRQAAHYHLSRLVQAGELSAVGKGRGSRYVRSSIWSGQFEIQGLEEHVVWRDLTEAVATVGGLPQNAAAIARFAFTEMLNNAIDHSGSEGVAISVGNPGKSLLLSIADEGVGAFEHVRRMKKLEDHVAAIQEIAKGKLTTDPSRHSGQGIFFTSKAVAVFVLASNGWKWVVDNIRGDESISRVRPHRGTRVQFVIDPETSRSLKSVFDEYTDEGTFAFDKTRTIVRLFEVDVSFVSRSEAKRLVRNLEQFAEVVVDFEGVEEIGQGFADEIFRVWQSEHPDTQLLPVNMNESVELLVELARKSAE